MRKACGELHCSCAGRGSVTASVQLLHMAASIQCACVVRAQVQVCPGASARVLWLRSPHLLNTIHGMRSTESATLGSGAGRPKWAATVASSAMFIKDSQKK